MTGVYFLILKLLLILIFAVWVSLWVLKATEFWTRKWKEAEDKASSSVFGYNGLDFVVYTFPLIALAIVGFIYLELKQREPRKRKGRRSGFTSFSNPLIVNKYIGILSAAQILGSFIFIIFLVWTFYARVSNDFKKMIPIKSFKLSLWQYKLFRMATRCGLLSEACLALLLLPVLRGMSVFRLVGIQFEGENCKFGPLSIAIFDFGPLSFGFEASVRYHIWLGTSMIFFAILHGGGTLFIWGMKHRMQEEMWKWQKKGRIYLAGEMALTTALVIYITALPQIRRKWFHLFYYTHHLYIIFIIFFLFHGGDRHFYMVLPGVFLFALDKLLRVIQSRPETYILSARIFPSKAIELTLPKDRKLKYTPTSVVFLKIPSISKFQWHPFSITSSSSIDEDTFSIIIKSEGQWTSSLYNKICDGSDSEQRKCIQVAVEGPYGPATLEFLRYKNLLMVAGGIGITPLLSILQEISSNLSRSRSGYPDRMQLIYVIKKSQEACLLDPILPQLFDIENFRIKLKVYVTQENQVGTTIREVLRDMPETMITNFTTTSSSPATYGPERLLWMAVITMVSSIIFLLSLVCFNRFFIPPAKKSSGQKNSSSQIDILLVCSFAIAIGFSAFMAMTIRRKRLKDERQMFSDKQSEDVKQSSLEASRDLDEHEIHFGGRPNFQDMLSSFTSESGGSDIGVFVCGPEAMKESVASEFRLAQRNNKGKIQRLSFHSLNFTL